MAEVQPQHHVALLVVAPPIAGDRLLVEEVELAELVLEELGHVAPVALSVKLGQQDVLLLALQLLLLVAQQQTDIGAYSFKAKRLLLQGDLHEYLFIQLEVDLKVFIESQAFEDAVGEGRVTRHFQQI